MTKKFQSTFHEGFDRDTSIDKYDNTHFFNAENVRIISNSPLSNAAITSIRGTLPKATIHGEGNKILGSCCIRDEVILFVYTPSGGRIYKFVDSGSFEPVAGELTLIYSSSDLVFQENKPIYAEGRYESERVKKIYFTDGETLFKHLNIVPDDMVTYPLTNSVESMDVISSVEFGQISAKLVQGGSLKSGKVQYSCQLFSVKGSESVFSPGSPLLSISESFDDSRSSLYVHGIKAGQIVDKSAIVTVPILSSIEFNRMRLVALDYESANQPPSIRIVGEYDITGLSTIDVVDTGSSIGELTLSQFRFITNNFYPESIASKDNILFVGNIKEEYFDISIEDFDSRAYRYKNDSGTYKSLIYDSFGTNGQSSMELVYGNAIDVPITHDCFNNFNNLDNDGTGNDYNLNPLTQTLGGFGKNISFEFVSKQVKIDDGYVKTALKYGDSVTYDKLTSEIDSSEDLISNFANYIGFQRDEIYRFGIVFYDLKGRPSFVLWIADIRFPNNEQIPFITKIDSSVYANILGIKFNVDTSSIASQISGYQIVRCERSDADRTVKDSGVMACLASPFNYYGTNNDVDGKSHSVMTMPSIYDCYNGKIMAKRYPTGASYSKHYSFLDDEKIDKKLWEFVSPNICFNKRNDLTPTDFIEGVGYLNGITGTAVIDVHATNLWVAEKTTNFVGFSKNTFGSIIKKSIDNSKLFTQTRPVESIFGLENGVSYMNICGNLVYGDGTADTMFSERGAFIAMQFNTEFNLSEYNQTLNNSEARWLLSYIRNNRNLSLYNGISFEARLTNNYIAASKFIPKTESSVSSYYGDTYINMFLYLRSIYTNTIEGKRSGQVIMMFPVESKINVQLRTDEFQKYLTWYFGTASSEPRYCLNEKSSIGIEKFNVDYPLEIDDLYRYNEAYSLQDSSRIFTTRPQDLDSNSVFDTRVYASNVKISGEYTDSWLKFNFNSYKDLDSQYGKLNGLFNVNNKLIYVQDDGVGILSVNDRALVNSPTSYTVTLGIGGILERFDYLAFQSGAQFPEDVVVSNKTFYYVDRKRKLINKYEGVDTKISVIKGINSLLKSADFDRVRTGFDSDYSDVIFSIDGLTFSFNELTNNFGPVQKFSPDGFVNVGKRFYSIADTENSEALSSDGIINIDYDNFNNFIIVRDSTAGNTLFRHDIGSTGKFYNDATSDSIIDFIVHPEGENVCSFSNLDLRMDITDSDGVEQYDPSNETYQPIFDTIKKIKFSNSYMSKEYDIVFYRKGYVLNPNTEVFIRKIGKCWRIQIPVQPDSKVPSRSVRFVDMYLQVKITFDNSTTNKWRLYDVTTYYDNI